jgi:hypothetical protein
MSLDEIMFQVFNEEDLQQQVSEAVATHFDEGQAPRRIRLHASERVRCGRKPGLATARIHDHPAGWFTRTAWRSFYN